MRERNEINMAGRSPEQIARACFERLNGANFVRIDGHSFTGKSALAHALVAMYGFLYVCVDDFIDAAVKERGVPAKVRRDLFRRMVRSAIATGPTVAEGVCLDDVLPEESAPGAFRVYMRNDINSAFMKDEMDRRQSLGTDIYHQIFKPEEMADLIIDVGQLHP